MENNASDSLKNVFNVQSLLDFGLEVRRFKLTYVTYILFHHF